MTKGLKHKTTADLIITSSIIMLLFCYWLIVVVGISGLLTWPAIQSCRSPIHTASTTLMQISALKSAVLSWVYGELTDFHCTDDDALSVKYWNE